MSNNNVIEEKKKALLAYKEKILDEIKYSEKRIDDFRANLKKNRFYDDHAISSDSEDDFPSAIDLGPSITQLKLQQTMKKTCLHATHELTGLMVLQSEVDVLVEEPKFEGERPVTESGTWREVTAECRIDLVPFTMTFFMHTPDRKFGPPSYRGLRVVPVKSSHELELSKSVLHSLKVPSDAVEVLRSYAAGYRSRRTTLARLANRYTNALFMEPHAEGGFVMKCADLLEVSWKLENKWSPVAPFHHKMKFDLEFMEESFIKIITQAHKELLDPALQTDERTLLLAKIITTCLEARGPLDPESDLESKTTERDNDIDRRDSENEKRDSEVMAPPKSLPKKTKQKKTSSLPNTAEKRKMDDEDDDSGAKKMKNDDSETKKSITDNNNARKSKINDVASEGGKKRKMSEANKVVSSKILKETDNIKDGNTNSKEIHKEDKTSNTKTKNVRETDKNAKNLKENEDSADKPKNMKESAANKDKNTNIKTKNKVSKEVVDTVAKETKPKTKVLKEPAKIDSNSKTKIVKDTVKNQENGDNDKLKDKNTIDTVPNKESVTKKVVKEPSNKEKVKNNANKAKNTIMKEMGNVEDPNQNGKKTKNKVKNVANVESKEKIDVNNEAGPPTTKITGRNTNNEKNIVEKSNHNDNNVEENNHNGKATKNNVKNVGNVKSKENVDVINDAGHPINKITGKNTNKEKINVEEGNRNGNNIEENNHNDKKTKKIVKNDANVKNKDMVDEKNEAGRPVNKITGKNTNKEKINVEESNHNGNNIEENNHNGKKTKNNVKNVANVKNKDTVDEKNEAGRPVNKITGKNTIDGKNLPTNINQIDPKLKNTDATKVKNVANAKNNDRTTRKSPEKDIKVASAKNDGQSKKVNEKNHKNKEKLPKVANKGAQKNIKEKTVPINVKSDAHIVKKVIEKNATNVRNKDKISPITTPVPDKIVKDKLSSIQDKPEKVLNSIINTKNKNIINKKPIITKIASHRNSLKPQNPPKVLKAGNTKIHTTGNIEKENGGKGSKIPQKTSTISEGSSKKNLLRMSPRIMPSKFKTQPQTLKQKMMKYTNIPRLLKKPAPKTN